MKKLFKLNIIGVILFLGFSTNLVAQTQSEMNQTAINNFNKVDNELNLVYKNLAKKLNEKEKNLLITAQKNWIKFRDSKCAFEKEEYNGGSIQALIYYTCLAESTNDRTKELKKNLKDRDK